MVSEWEYEVAIQTVTYMRQTEPLEGRTLPF